MIIKTSYPFMKPPPSARLIRGHRSAQGLACLLSFGENGGLQVFDSSEYGNTGTITGATWTAGPFGSALDFDGSDGKIQISDAPSIQNIFAGGGTVSIWINPRSDGEGGYGRVIDKSAENTVGWWLIVTSQAVGRMKFRFGRYSSGNNGAWETTNTVIPINTLAHIAVTFNDDDINNLPLLYMNGRLVAQVQTSDPGITYISDAGADLYIGNNQASPSNRTFDGLIDVPMFHNRILSASEIAEVYWRPFCMFERRARTALMSGYEVGVPPTGHPYYYREIANRRIA